MSPSQQELYVFYETFYELIKESSLMLNDSTKAVIADLEQQAHEETNAPRIIDMYPNHTKAAIDKKNGVEAVKQRGLDALATQVYDSENRDAP